MCYKNIYGIIKNRVSPYKDSLVSKSSKNQEFVLDLNQNDSENCLAKYCYTVNLKIQKNGNK